MIEIRIRHAGQELTRSGGGEVLGQHRGIQALKISGDLADAHLLKGGHEHVQPMAAAGNPSIDEEILMQHQRHRRDDGAVG